MRAKSWTLNLFPSGKILKKQHHKSPQGSKGDRISLEVVLLRPLGVFERALFLSDQHSPFNVVTVLRLENPPAPQVVESSLLKLRERHPLLGACIKDGSFEQSTSPFSFVLAESDWISLVEREMNKRLDSGRQLFRGVYNYSPQHADLILTFHHASMDAASGMNLLDELLRLCASDENPPLSPLEVAPPVEQNFPRPYKGVQGVLRIIQYAFAQMADEIRYQFNVRGKRTPPVQLGGRGFASTLVLPEDLVDALAKRCRAENVTLNSLLNSVLALATNRHIYAGASLPMRTFSFADLRPHVIPPLPAEHLANYISMLRLTADVSGTMNLWELTKHIHVKIYRALKQGEKFTAALVSESLMKMFTRMKSMRMGAVGLSYGGAVPLKAQYGNIKVIGLHAFLSSFDLGPEVSCQARLFDHELWLDFMFLETDMDREMAEKIVGEVKVILEEAGRG
jgi:NRPS condensation-like uncharacterized protein